MAKRKTSPSKKKASPMSKFLSTKLKQANCPFVYDDHLSFSRLFDEELNYGITIYRSDVSYNEDQDRYYIKCGNCDRKHILRLGYVSMVQFELDYDNNLISGWILMREISKKDITKYYYRLLPFTAMEFADFEDGSLLEYSDFIKD